MALDIRSLEIQRNDPHFTYISNGVSQGVSPTNNDPVAYYGVESGLVPSEMSNPAYNRWGQGLPIMSDYTHAIYVQGPTDILTWGSETQITPQGFASFNLDYTGTFFEVIFHEGQQFLRLDWPCSIGFTLNATNSTPIQVYVWGEDWYGLPMMMAYTPSAPGMAEEGTYSCLGVPDGVDVPLVSNKAFFLIGKVFIVGQLDAGVVLTVQTVQSYGLPVAINNASQVISIGLTVHGVYDGSDMGTDGGVGSPLAPLGTLTLLDQTIATATTGDVRGTYAPSRIGPHTSLYFKYYAQPFCPNLAMLTNAGQPTPLVGTSGQTTVGQRGVTQYWTEPPTSTGG